MPCPFHVLFFNVGGDYFAVINWWSSLVWQVLQNSPFLTFISLCRAFLLIWKKLVLSGTWNLFPSPFLPRWCCILPFLSRYYQVNILPFRLLLKLIIFFSRGEIRPKKKKKSGIREDFVQLISPSSSPVLNVPYWFWVQSYRLNEPKHIFLNCFTKVLYPLIL